MATTGLTLNRFFYEKIGQPFTGFYDPVKMNRLFKQALYQAIEVRYKNLAEQREFDEITSVVKTEQPFTPVGNQLSTTIGTGIISDYNHLLAIKAKFTVNLFLSLSGATNATPIVITLNERSNLRTGDNIEITSVIGNTAANGVFFIKKLSDFRFALYSDEFFQIPVIGNGAYISGGSVFRVYYKYCKMFRSDQKVGVLAQATVDYPKYETVTGLIKIYPVNQVCQQVTLDYITTAAVLVDVSDNVIDLELTYPFQFLMYLVTTASEIFSGEVKDGEQQRTQEIDLSEAR